MVSKLFGIVYHLKSGGFLLKQLTDSNLTLYDAISCKVSTRIWNKLRPPHEPPFTDWFLNLHGVQNRCGHRVDRVLGFFSSRPNCNPPPPTPSPAGERVSPLGWAFFLIFHFFLFFRFFRFKFFASLQFSNFRFEAKRVGKLFRFKKSKIQYFSH